MGINITPQKLAQALNSAWRTQRSFREAGDKAIKDYVGPHYGTNGAENGKREPVNFISQYMMAMVPNLAPRKVRNKVSAWNIGLKLEGVQLGLALDRADLEEEIDETLRQCVVQALVYPCGCTMTGLTVGCQLVKIDGQMRDPGKLFTRAIAFEDILTDPAARRRSEALWDAHRYRVSKQALKESGIFNPDAVDGIPILQGASGNSSSTIGGADHDRYGLVETVELIDVAIYDGNDTWIVTLAGQPNAGSGDVVSNSGKILYQEKFQGPEDGPYSFLEFHPLSNRVMALPPVAMIQDLHRAKALVSAKVVEMILATKRILGYARTGGADDAESVKDAQNFQSVAMDDPKSAQMFDFGGVPKEIYDGMEWIDRQFEQQAATQRISGASGGENTATEATQLQANSMVRVQDMQERVKKFRVGIARQRLWYLANDPLIRRGLPYRTPGGEMIQMEYSAEAREGSPTDFNIEIEVTTPESSDPNIRMRRLIEFLQVLPTQVPLAQAGLLDLAAEIRLFARELDMQELDEIIPSAGSAMQTAMVHQNDPQMQPGMPVGMSPGNPQAGQVQVGQESGDGSSNPTDQMTSAYQPAMQGGV